jgi:hypothetical protein
MKKNLNQNENARNTRVNSKASQSGGKRVENKDNLDSRSGEEQDYKGDDVTHNERETKEGKQKKHREP